jgi:hypothetical protein
LILKVLIRFVEFHDRLMPKSILRIAPHSMFCTTRRSRRSQAGAAEASDLEKKCTYVRFKSIITCIQS